jgi:hypothetical protein
MRVSVQGDMHPHGSTFCRGGESKLAEASREIEPVRWPANGRRALPEKQIELAPAARRA